MVVIMVVVLNGTRLFHRNPLQEEIVTKRAVVLNVLRYGKKHSLSDRLQFHNSEQSQNDKDTGVLKLLQYLLSKNILHNRMNTFLAICRSTNFTQSRDMNNLNTKYRKQILNHTTSTTCSYITFAWV
jgi:LytS/YehU family sensor histidine kinase